LGGADCLVLGLRIDKLPLADVRTQRLVSLPISAFAIEIGTPQ
jgi:hypothetical protein